MSRPSLRIQYSMCNAFGARQEFLDVAGTVEATAAERISSIWGFVVRKALAFDRTLKPNERANFDLDDLLAELYVALAERDHLWTPERGKYITFAGAIIDHALYAIRDKARTVESPRNSSCRLKEYQKEEDAGTITPRRLKTANDIRRSGDRTTEVNEDKADFGFSTKEEPAAILIRRHDADDATEGLLLAIQQLPHDQAEALIRFHGVFGAERESARDVALFLGRDEQAARNLLGTARRAVKRFLIESGHASATAAA